MEGKKIQIIFIDTPTVFPGKNSQDRKQFLAETYNGKCLHFLLHSEVLGTLGQLLILSTGVLSCRLQSEIPVDFFFIFSHVLNLTN